MSVAVQFVADFLCATYDDFKRQWTKL